jgi:hypothetical protein
LRALPALECGSPRRACCGLPFGGGECPDTEPKAVGSLQHSRRRPSRFASAVLEHLWRGPPLNCGSLRRPVAALRSVAAGAEGVCTLRAEGGSFAQQAADLEQRRSALRKISRAQTFWVCARQVPVILAGLRQPRGEHQLSVYFENQHPVEPTAKMAVPREESPSAPGGANLVGGSLASEVSRACGHRGRPA